jgi:hypothetical protein
MLTTVGKMVDDYAVDTKELEVVSRSHDELFLRCVQPAIRAHALTPPAADLRALLRRPSADLRTSTRASASA